MDITKECATMVSFCSGYGGLELGVRRVISIIRTIAYVEIEAFACANLVAKMEAGKLDAAPIWTDLKTFNAEPFRSKVDIIMGGYPCQPFSTAGKRKGTDDPRHLWPYIAKHIRTIKPVFCFFENVEGHLSLGFREVKQDLEEMGYGVEAGLFSAAEVGAPHQRKRLFILGYSRQQSEGVKGFRFGSRKECCSKELKSSTGNRLANSSELANTGPSMGCAEQEQQQEELPKEFQGSVDMADTNSTGSQRRDGRELQERTQQWPSRPGNPQFPWEAPRTTEPSLGRASYGIRTRVDELRLLGNGVVPQTAEKAFRTLLERINK